MGFTIGNGPPVQKTWSPIINTDTLYVGQLVKVDNEGVQPLAVASGAADTSQKQLPWGVVVGHNRKIPIHDTSFQTDSITYVDPSSANAEDYISVEGVWARGDLQAMVEVALIDSTTILRGPLFTDSFGTAPTVGTLSGSPTTTTATTSAVEESGIAKRSTMFVRTGVAAGHIRVTDDASPTAITWDLPLTVASVAGDKIVRVNLTPQGPCQVNTDSQSLFIDTGATVSSNYFLIDVVRLDLRIAGSEYVEFRFHGDHFNTLRT